MVVQAQSSKPYTYVRVGSPVDVVVKTQGGFALMGGGTDLDVAFRWMCAHAGGGDFLILRSHGTDAYNSYVQGLCHVNSVATLIIPSREAASAPKVAEIIGKAEAIFFAGGDQAQYINFWRGTPVEDAVNAAIARGVPVGGTSAGLAVQGEYIYSAQNDAPEGPDLSSKAALADPLQRQVVVVRGFLKNPLLADTITDSHFVRRDRMGRLLVMMARVLEDGRAKELKGMGVDQETAVLLEASGEATVVGRGAVYFLRAGKRPERLKAGEPLDFWPVSAVKVTEGGRFDVKEWRGATAPYVYTVEAGVVKSSRGGAGIY
ncbi:MAG: cyanophycinase [Acidobacteriaceae bacterium]